MSWAPVTRGYQIARLPGVRVTVVHKGRQKNVVFALGEDVLDRAGWKVGDSVGLLVGTDEHAGRIAMQTGTDLAAFRINANGGKGKVRSGRVQCAAHRMGGADWPMIASVPAEATAEPGRIVVTLPEALTSGVEPLKHDVDSGAETQVSPIGSGPMPSPHSGGCTNDGAGATPCGAPEPPPVVRDDRTPAPKPAGRPGPPPPKQEVRPRVRPDEAAAIAAAIAAGKVTRCPPAYVGTVEGAKPVTVPVYDVGAQQRESQKAHKRMADRAARLK